MTLRRLLIAAGLLATALAAPAQTASRQTYIVQLSDAPAASYAGGISGFAATRPAAGARLDVNASNVRAYLGLLSTRRSAALARVAGAPVLHTYGVAFNGFAAKLTAAEAATLKRSAGVATVTPSRQRQPVTTRTPEFLGLSAPGGLWSQLDPASRPVKGEGVIIGMLDTGIWPEDPSFGDKQDATGKPVAYFQPGTQVYGPPPAKWKGTCQTGPGFTAAMCNNKLIGARFYEQDFASNATPDSFEYLSPRDGDGHGSHTSSTSGGNANVDASIDGVSAGVMSGMAPRARIATYKVCWTATVAARSGCYDADTVKAIDDAVADGVDVISFSVGGTASDFTDPVEVAYFNAAAAGVFVSVAGGNDGPANKVEHPSPWLTTVAASTHDRYTVATVTLGSGAVFKGPSYQRTGLTSKPLILAQNAGVVPFASLTATDQTALMRCYNDADRASMGGSPNAVLDPAKAAGHIVVCIRGGNVLVNKGASVKAAGGVGMIIQNAPGTNNSVINQPYLIPTVHLDVGAYPTVAAYAATAGATASFGPGVQQSGVIAPVMADFSSRGPNLANDNILKPDISAPGVDIIAGYRDDLLTQGQHDAVAAGNLTPPANAASLQGTSMATPHIAGIAALLKQLHPGWSPAAIKSAMMTTTGGDTPGNNPTHLDIKLADGTLDPNRWGYGAGHVNPTPAGDPGLVYDAGVADYHAFLCGLSLPPPAGSGSCSAAESAKKEPWNLNLASLTAGEVTRAITFTRTVTNVGAATSTYVFSSSLPGWTVAPSTPTLVLRPGESRSFDVTVTRTSAPVGAWTFGSLSWTDNNQHVVRSPLSVKALGFNGPASVSDVRASGTGAKVFTVVSAYSGLMTVTSSGLVPATRSAGSVALGAAQCFNFSVPAGALAARFQLFDADTLGGGAGTDLDLTVYNGADGTGSVVGASGTNTSNEVVTLDHPAPGPYSACVVGYATPNQGATPATFTMSSWIVGAPSGVQTLKAVGPSTVYAGGAASVVLSWKVPAGQRYLGAVDYSNPADSSLLGTTIVSVDNH